MVVKGAIAVYGADRALPGYPDHPAKKQGAVANLKVYGSAIFSPNHIFDWYQVLNNVYFI